MKLQEPTTPFDSIVLTVSERRAVSSWLSTKLQSYQSKVSKSRLLPGQIAVDALLRSGLSSLKRRYRKTPIAAHAVVWGWLGREQLLGRIDQGVSRMRQGGIQQEGWKWSAMLEGGWMSETQTNGEVQRLERIISCLPRCPGATYDDSSDGGTYVLGPHSLTLLHQMLRRHYPHGTGGVDLLALDVAVLVLKGQLTGDCLRYQCGGHLDVLWWSRIKQAIVQDDLAVSRSTVSELDAAVCHWYQVRVSTTWKSTDLPSVLSPEKVFWVLDICCGFRSLNAPVKCAGADLVARGGRLRCIGLDIVPHQIRHTETISPDWCVDLLDGQLLPRGQIVSSVCRHFGLNMHYLLHVHASPPCDTNSRADASNLNRGCGYRDWHSLHCMPLPSSTDTPPAAGHTTEAHRQLAVQHDWLERKLFQSLLGEATAHGFSWTVENPVGECLL